MSTSPSDDRLLGEINERTRSLVDDMRVIKESVVTKELLDAKFGLTQRFIVALIGFMLLSFGGLLVAGALNDDEPAPVPEVNVIVPTAPPKPAAS